MEVPANGFFKDKSKDSSSENPVYVRSISYGKIALLAIESEYSFEEVKKAVEAGIKWKIFNAGGSFSAKDTEILQKTTITLSSNPQLSSSASFLRLNVLSSLN